MQTWRFTGKSVIIGSMIGQISVHPRGFGFVTCLDETMQKDVFIPKKSILNALHGDTVEVELTGEHPEKGPEGIVTKVLKRAKTHLCAIVTESGIVVPSAKSAHFRVNTKGFLPGDRVKLKVTKWDKTIAAKIEERLGSIEDPASDILFAAEDFHIPKEFPQTIEEEMKGLSSRLEKNELSWRKDLREMLSVTIDPDDAKDFDDALSCQERADGSFDVAIHIADVSYYVRPGTHLDAQAYARGNSTYYPGLCLPMLPRKLSEDLCSLKPHVQRRCLSVLARVSAEGDVTSYEICKSLIKSAERFTYKQAFSVLDGHTTSPHAPLLFAIAKLGSILRKKRKGRGSIEFSMPELKVRVDQKGVPTAIEFIEHDSSHQMVEECMLLANEVVAKHLASEGKEQIFRVHEAPNARSLDDFYMLVRAFGHKLPPHPTLGDVQNLFSSLKGVFPADILSMAFIRTQSLALYSPEGIGHFGLALDAYCHFTSPIRRYSDLVTHRLLFNEEKTDYETLAKISAHISETERRSTRSAMSVQRLKLLRYLGKLFEKDPTATYEAWITSVNPSGIVFEAKPCLIEGFFHVHELPDFFRFSRNTLIGQKTGRKYSCGQKLCVRVTSIDLISSEVSFLLCK